jgi:HEAT repeat protein
MVSKVKGAHPGRGLNNSVFSQFVPLDALLTDAATHSGNWRQLRGQVAPNRYRGSAAGPSGAATGSFGQRNPVPTKAIVNKLVGDLLARACKRSVYERLGKCGQLGVDAVLDALEGKHGLPPKRRHPRDVHEGLVGGLYAIAKVNPDPLINTLNRRPEHARDLIWALGGSGHVAAVKKLLEYAKHQDMWVRWAAVEGLVRCGKQHSLLQPLLDALRDRSDMVRYSALQGLVKVADHTAIEPLKRYLASKRLSPGGKRLASELLAKLEKARVINGEG